MAQIEALQATLRQRGERIAERERKLWSRRAAGAGRRSAWRRDRATALRTGREESVLWRSSTNANATSRQQRRTTT